MFIYKSKSNLNENKIIYINKDNIQNFNWQNISPGTKVYISLNDYKNPITINANGSKQNEIEIINLNESTNTQNVIRNSFDFQNSSYIKLKGFTVSNSPYGAVIIRNNSHNITIENNILTNSYMGINISENPGSNIRIINNIIKENKTHGIAVQYLNSEGNTDSTRSEISNNNIINNGHHGIELQSNYFVISSNTVSYNGHSIGGASGIHLYSRSERENTGDFNIITNNISSHNQDDILHWDGNGIQADQWCDNNIISGNKSFNNDGAGIILYDSQNNKVFNNILYNNAQDLKRNPNEQGEIILSSEGLHMNMTHHNEIYNNQITVSRDTVKRILTDELSSTLNLIKE